jgi:hypothetical protein
VWYHFIHIGDVQHIQMQARIHTAQGIWVTVRFATGKQIRFWQSTDKKGFWQANFKVPAGTIGRNSNQATVTFQLWKGKRTTRSVASFRVIR